MLRSKVRLRVGSSDGIAVFRLPHLCGVLLRLFCSVLLASMLPPFVWAWSGPVAIADPQQEDRPLDIEARMTYRAGTRLRIPGTDWSFVVPDRWHGSRPEDSAMPFLIAEEGKGLGMIFPLADVNRESLHDQLSQPLSLLHGLSFIPIGSEVETETSIARSYQGDEMVGRALGLLGPGNACVLYFFMGPPQEMSTFETVLERLARSTRFTDPILEEGIGL
ncbi:MAG: hypothetical protein OJF47_002747 [Nitrospira sp.]|jgi:hypothetical protein|nr:MAG: hypothetical protein OJF47_002747 [Nitrospira sp.]